MTIAPSLDKLKQSNSMSRRSGEFPLVDVANIVTAARPGTPMGSPDTLKAAVQFRRISRARSPIQAKSTAVPFPTISEEGNDDNAFSSPDPVTEEKRTKDWAREIERRQENIKELRDKKLRLEQTQASRVRKSSPSFSYLTSPERKLTFDDLEFLVALHASVVWRLWHVDLAPEVFASERLLATRLHLVLMRNGRQNIPVPPIVALAKSHHLMQSYSMRHMMDKDRPGIQTLPQLVAKSLLRQKKPAKRSRLALQRQVTSFPLASSPLAKESETFSSSSDL